MRHSVPFGIENCASMPDVHMVSCGRRDVRRLGQAGLVDALRGFDDLVQLGRDLRWGHAPTENVLGGNNGAVELLVCVLALDEDGAFQREPREETCKKQMCK